MELPPSPQTLPTTIVVGAPLSHLPSATTPIPSAAAVKVTHCRQGHLLLCPFSPLAQEIEEDERKERRGSDQWTPPFFIILLFLS